MNRDIRAALIGGLAATFVVAASLAPKLLDQPGQVTVHNSSTESAVGDTSTSPDPAVTSTTEAPVTTSTTASTIGDLPARVGGLEQRVTRIEATTTTTVPAKPDVSFYFEGTVGIGPDAEAAPYDGTWKVVFRTMHTEPGLRVHYMANTTAGPAEFVAEFSDTRPMYTLTAVGHIDAALLDVPANPPRQSASRVFFDRIVSVEWDGGSQVY